MRYSLLTWSFQKVADCGANSEADRSAWTTVGNAKPALGSSSERPRPGGNDAKDSTSPALTESADGTGSPAAREGSLSRGVRCACCDGRWPAREDDTICLRCGRHQCPELPSGCGWEVGH
jgi:hypothetical protein